MTPRPLLLLGAGGLAREALAAVRALPEQWQPLGALDDDPARHGALLDGLPVLGGTQLVHEHPDAAVLACVANARRPRGRAELVRRLGLPHARWASVVHPACSLAPGVEVGAGALLLAGVVVTAPQRIGAHVVAMPHVLLTHDDEVGDFATLAGRATLAGGVRLGQSAYVGQGALLREYTSIGEAAVIGMGAVVLTDVPPGQTWAGNPAGPLPTDERRPDEVR
ncbi:NeuD/PglB/VioB family sugar acetyltransferase [Amycolatopsis aidingensis]|uniref:NeuD/PglB/VioB family sugar acetyltransferase n=1 Tax=Amycolatopsis aidingensis TaxID=2842453 RepID=UPI001C0BE036|nr:NeuD/PglB/VioB family sugar acetyltransferase [Amycolatopsis aidingensis]